MIRVEHFEDSTDLARGIQVGDADVYAAFFNRLYAPVFERARYLLKNHEDAEDATQEVFSKAWEKRAKYDPAGGDFVGWFLVLAERTLLDAYRKRKRQHQIEVTTLDTLVAEETLEVIESVLLEIKPAYRLTFYLHFFEGYNYAEIARIMASKKNTVKVRIHRTRQRILTILGETDEH